MDTISQAATVDPMALPTRRRNRMSGMVSTLERVTRVAAIVTSPG
jgi:hypothetical protein